VLQHIRQERGGMFDPRIVDLFIEHLDELEAIKQRLSDPAKPLDSEDISGPVHCPIR
jgi:HD-GYP domain-containing protein (c-di-GMP phosphodiesterase class II)